MSHTKTHSTDHNLLIALCHYGLCDKHTFLHDFMFFQSSVLVSFHIDLAGLCSHLVFCCLNHFFTCSASNPDAFPPFMFFCGFSIYIYIDLFSFLVDPPCSSKTSSQGSIWHIQVVKLSPSVLLCLHHEPSFQSLLLRKFF